MLEICINGSNFYSSFILNSGMVVGFLSGLCSCTVLHTPLWKNPPIFRLSELLLILMAYPNPITSAFLSESGDISVNNFKSFFRSFLRGYSFLARACLITVDFFSTAKKIPYCLVCFSWHFMVCACTFYIYRFI